MADELQQLEEEIEAQKRGEKPLNRQTFRRLEELRAERQDSTRGRVYRRILRSTGYPRAEEEYYKAQAELTGRPTPSQFERAERQEIKVLLRETGQPGAISESELKDSRSRKQLLEQLRKKKAGEYDTSTEGRVRRLLLSTGQTAEEETVRAIAENPRAVQQLERKAAGFYDYAKRDGVTISERDFSREKRAAEELAAYRERKERESALEIQKGLKESGSASVFSLEREVTQRGGLKRREIVGTEFQSTPKPREEVITPYGVFAQSGALVGYREQAPEPEQGKPAGFRAGASSVFSPILEDIKATGRGILDTSKQAQRGELGLLPFSSIARGAKPTKPSTDQETASRTIGTGLFLGTIGGPAFYALGAGVTIGSAAISIKNKAPARYVFGQAAANVALVGVSELRRVPRIARAAGETFLDTNVALARSRKGAVFRGKGETRVRISPTTKAFRSNPKRNPNISRTRAGEIVVREGDRRSEQTYRIFAQSQGVGVLKTERFTQRGETYKAFRQKTARGEKVTIVPSTERLELAFSSGSRGTTEPSLVPSKVRESKLYPRGFGSQAIPRYPSLEEALQATAKKEGLAYVQILQRPFSYTTQKRIQRAQPFKNVPEESGSSRFFRPSSPGVVLERPSAPITSAARTAPGIKVFGGFAGRESVRARLFSRLKILKESRRAVIVSPRTETNTARAGVASLPSGVSLSPFEKFKEGISGPFASLRRRRRPTLLYSEESSPRGIGFDSPRAFPERAVPTVELGGVSVTYGEATKILAPQATRVTVGTLATGERTRFSLDSGKVSLQGPRISTATDSRRAVELARATQSDTAQYQITGKAYDTKIDYARATVSRNDTLRALSQQTRTQSIFTERGQPSTPRTFEGPASRRLRRPGRETTRRTGRSPFKLPEETFTPRTPSRSSRYQRIGVGRFSVEVRRGGVFRSVTSRPLTLRQAVRRGVESTSTTAAASFRVREGRQILSRVRGVPASYTRSTRERGVFIQRPSERISTLGEKIEITRKGLIALKTRRVFT